MTQLDEERAREVLRFWLGDVDAPYAFEPAVAERWFKKDPAFDDEIRRRFGALIAAAQEGALVVEGEGPRLRLAQVILLDQLSRNAYRDSPRMYAGDERALALVETAVASGDEQALTVVERCFLYMPLMHSEERAHQEDSVRRFRALVDELPPAVREAPLGKYLAEALRFAVLHADIVERFGRFPHRNAILGRDSSDEERRFLTQPGSSF